MALANEVRPFGISVTAVLPGDIRTGFTDARTKSEAGDDVYGGRIVRSVGKMEQDERRGMAPEKAGRRIAAIALSRSRKPVKTLGVSYKLIYLLVKFLPVSLVNRLISILYVK